MDRFFKAYNYELLQRGYRPVWFFSGGEVFDFYSDFNLYVAEEQENLENLALSFLEKNEVDIVVTHFLALCTPFLKQLKVERNPYVIAVDHNPRPLHGFSWKKRIKNKLKGKLYSRYIDLFVGVSEYTVDCILKDYGSSLHKKTKLVYNGIDTSLTIKRSIDNKGKFIVASHLRESKGIQDLIEAVNRLNETAKTSIRIDIYGEGPLENILKEKVQTYDLEKQFRFMGSSSNLLELFHYYSYLLQPTYMECFSLSILESLAANVPVITTPVGGNPEVILDGENGFLFPPGDVTALSVLLERLHRGELEISGDVSELMVAQYNLEKMVKGHINLLPCI